ncbi:hypothetical protein [Nonomuraea typhae]|uniref:Uncharacterized protein n=1 Tax=Nonomuraea typhae TaxID=2603600 RepID=A0ABW7YNE5_9ACTN
MTRTVAALAAAFVVGNLMFLGAVVHIVLTGRLSGIAIAVIGAACATVCATVGLLVRQRPRIKGINTAADVYEMGLEQVSVGR